MGKIRISYISTWNKQCGIAEYSKFLINEINKHNNIIMNIIPVSDLLLKNLCNLLIFALNARKTCEIVHIQYQRSFFILIHAFKITFFPLSSMPI